MAKKSLIDYPQAMNRITEKIISEYGGKLSSIEDFTKAFKEYMNDSQDKRTTEQVHNQYLIRTGQTKIKEITFSQASKEIKKGFQYKGSSKGIIVLARKEILKIRGKPVTKYRDTKGRFVKMVERVD